MHSRFFDLRRRVVTCQVILGSTCANPWSYPHTASHLHFLHQVCCRTSGRSKNSIGIFTACSLPSVTLTNVSLPRCFRAIEARREFLAYDAIRSLVASRTIRLRECERLVYWTVRVDLAFDNRRDAFDSIEPKSIGWCYQQLNANHSCVCLDRVFFSRWTATLSNSRTEVCARQKPRRMLQRRMMS